MPDPMLAPERSEANRRLLYCRLAPLFRDGENRTTIGGNLEPLSIPLVMADAKIQYVVPSYTMAPIPVSLTSAVFPLCGSFWRSH